MRSSHSSNRKRSWVLLSWLWGIWIFFIFVSAGQSFVQEVIWVGALAVGCATLPVVMRSFHVRQLPPEVQLLAIFWLWSFLGILVAVDFELFFRYSRLIIQFILIVIFLSLIIARSGATTPIFLAFTAVGAVLPVIHTLGIDGGLTMESLHSGDRDAEANAQGFQSLLGILGVMALLPEIRGWLGRAALLVAGVISIYGVVLSGSKGAFVLLLSASTMWPLFCFKSLFRSHWITVAFVIVLAALGSQFYNFVMLETNLGRRFELMTQAEDGSTQTRLELILTGFRLAYEYYGLGAGLGQFGPASGTGFLYAHNEFAELLGTTGVVGATTYYFTYFTTWRRLQRGARLIKDRGALYRINFARMMLVLLVLSGLAFRINFLGQDSMFIYALIVGVSLWAVQPQPRVARRNDCRVQTHSVLDPRVLNS